MAPSSPTVLRAAERALLRPGVGQSALLAQAVVVLLPVDVDAIDDGVGAERMLVPDHDVGVLADLQRPDPRVDAQLLRGIDRHQRQRLVLGEAAPVHRLGRLGVQASRVFGAVGVHRHQHPSLVHERGVIGDGVLGFHLVGPPVRERRRAGAVRRNLVGDLVAFEHVLQRRHLEAHVVGEAEQHQDLVGAIRVGVHEPLALEDLDQRLELQIAARRGEVLAGFLAPVVLLPLALIGLGPAERVANHELHAGSRNRVAARTGLAELAHVLGVLAERELDAGHRALEHQASGRFAPPQLDHLVLPANRVGAAVQHVGRGEPAGEVAIDVDVGRIEHVFDARHRAHRRPALVDRVGADV